MSNIPNKIIHLLGYNNLSLVLEQERKHWLMKTDKNKQLQDKSTGDVFRGQIDNIGSDIILETEKTEYKNDILTKLSYIDTGCNYILSHDCSAFTYSSSVNGLMYSRIESINYPLSSGTEVVYKNYKLKLTNCTICAIPFGGSLNTDDVFVGRWLKTTSNPSILMIDDNEQYSIERSLSFNSDITNPVYYFPLTPSLQTIGIHDEGNGTYTTDMVNNNSMIGFPLYWFTCDQSNIGPTLSIGNNYNTSNTQLMFIGNEGNDSKYNAKLYIGIEGNNDATPDGSNTSNYVVRCYPKTGYEFTNSSADKTIPIDPSTITLYNTTTSTAYILPITCNTNDIITLNMNNLNWSRTDSVAEINMNEFDSNCLNVSQTSLIPFLNVHFDESIPFMNTTTDIGYAGIRLGSSNVSSDIYPTYPHDLNKWSGLPTWMNELDENGCPQHACVYAIHNTPSYNPSNPESRQTAGLILSPGKYDDTIQEEDKLGRVYVISNDPCSYENNGKTETQKPLATAARICDIPTSVIQLSGISGLAPVSIVDKKYTRTKASYDESDKERLYNTLSNKWVKPTDLDSNGHVIQNSNKFVFDNVSLLNSIDLIDFNDYRIYENLNPVVDPFNVSLCTITSSGTGYTEDDIGDVIVGGFAFQYTVTAVDENGGVTDLILTPSNSYSINLSNFDMTEGVSGISEIYGTSPRTNNGTGLKFRFIIDNYSDIITYKEELYPDLFALVKLDDGLWIFNYEIDSTSPFVPKRGNWIKSTKISEFEQSDYDKSTGGLSTSESYINSIIPTLREIPINSMIDGSNPLTLKAFTTSSFVNIVDKDKTPINSSTQTENMVDMCKWYCESLSRIEATSKTTQGIIDALKANNSIRFDSYVAWKWENDSQTNKYFIYGIIHRSMNNYMTSDTTTTLPKNELNCDNYVHVNQGTSVVWDVPDVGPMMWTYNPLYKKYEEYTINQSTQDLTITRKTFKWEDVDFRTTSSGNVVYEPLVSNGKLNYSILTNNPTQAPNHITSEDPIYQQPNLYQPADLIKGNSISNVTTLPTGSWQLVFPRVESFHFSNNTTSITPIKLQTIKTDNLSSIGNIKNDNDKNVNSKTFVLNQTSNGIEAKVYNEYTNTWNTL